MATKDSICWSGYGVSERITTRLDRASDQSSYSASVQMKITARVFFPHQSQPGTLSEDPEERGALRAKQLKLHRCGHQGVELVGTSAKRILPGYVYSKAAMSNVCLRMLSIPEKPS